jgi:rhodanese-related sulfurtransferase
MGVVALAVGVIYHLASSEALLANKTATASIQRAYAGAFIPRISLAKVRRLVGSDTVLIDARLARDYERGHLDRAVSLPVDANEVVWKRTTASIPSGKPIVVYCQSAGCKFAERVSVKLIEEGFKDISIYRGGWQDWTARVRAVETRSQ